MSRFSLAPKKTNHCDGSLCCCWQAYLDIALQSLLASDTSFLACPTPGCAQYLSAPAGAAAGQRHKVDCPVRDYPNARPVSPARLRPLPSSLCTHCPTALTHVSLAAVLWGSVLLELQGALPLRSQLC